MQKDTKQTEVSATNRAFGLKQDELTAAKVEAAREAVAWDMIAG